MVAVILILTLLNAVDSQLRTDKDSVVVFVSKNGLRHRNTVAELQRVSLYIFFVSP